MEDKTILILDDERSIREGIALVIREAFPMVQILTAQSGTEAYELICSRPVDVSITDIMVPELNGLQLIQRCVEAVSYTHLDVYKRQHQRASGRVRRRDAG